MPDSKRQSQVDVDNDQSDDNTTDSDSKETILRRLKKALRLAGKLQTKLDFEREVSKELARRNEQLKKDAETQDDVYITLKEAFQEMYLQFDDLLVRYDELLNTDNPEPGTDTHMEALRDYDEKMEFFQNIRARSGVDKSHHRNKSGVYSGGGRKLSVDDDQNVHLLRMSGSTFFRTSVHADHKDVNSVNDEIQKKTDSVTNKNKDKRTRSFTTHLSLSNTMGSIQKLVQPSSSVPTSVAPTTQPHNNISEADNGKSMSSNAGSGSTNVKDTFNTQSTTTSKGTSTPLPESFTNTPLFEHFLVIGVPIEPAAEMVDRINRKNESLSDRLKNQMGSFWKKSSSNTNLLGGKNGKAAPVVDRVNSISSVGSNNSSDSSPPNTSKKTSSLAGRWGELSKNLKAAGSQAAAGGGGGIFDMNILPSSGSSKAAVANSTPASNSTAPAITTPVSVPIASTRNSNISYTEPSILYRFPPDADPPPSEVCDFCLPSGGRLRHLVKPGDREESTLEMLYGQGQSQRSSRCFIFVLEDKTLDMTKNVPNEETGENTGRLFGICVVNPRLLNPYAPSNNPTGKYQRTTQTNSTTATPDVEFEAAVCYCFITRFPLFDFFFQILWNIIAFERISRMIDVSEHTAETRELDLYKYIPANVYDFVMTRLSDINPPRFGQKISLDIDSSLPPVSAIRTKPEGVLPEYFQVSAEWALPPLLHWLDAKTIVWALSFLLSEVKLIILGKDAATVSCAVIGLTALLKPFQWVSPMIPILPSKHLDFIESPVPIIAGIVLDPDSPDATVFQGNAVTPLNILRQCDDGDVTTVLDLDNKDIFTLSGYKKNIIDLLIPGALSLIEQIDHIITFSKVKENETNVATHPPYKVTKVHMDNFQAIQNCVHKHMKQVGADAKVKAKEILAGQVKVAEDKVKAQLEQLSSLKDKNNYRRASVDSGNAASLLFGTITESNGEEDSESDKEEDGENASSNEYDPNVTASSDSLTPTVGSGYTIPILSLTNMKFPTIRASHAAKFYERFISTQTYAEYDFEFEKLLQSVEAAVTGAVDTTEQDLDSLTFISSRTKRLSGRRSSVRKSLLLGGAVIHHEAKKSRGRSLYISPSDVFETKGNTESKLNRDVRLAQESALQSLIAEEKSSLQSKSTMMASHKAFRRESRAQSEGGADSGRSGAFLEAQKK